MSLRHKLRPTIGDDLSDVCDSLRSGGNYNVNYKRCYICYCIINYQVIKSQGIKIGSIYKSSAPAELQF